MPTTDAQPPNPPRLAADRARRLALARLASGWKEPVFVATTANVTLSNVQTIDGIAVPDGARVLVKDQTAGAENGIYEAKYGTWLRTSDADHPDKLGTATKVAVQRGTTNGGTTWRLTTTGTVTLGTTALTWAADGGSGGTLAGDVTGAIGSNSIAARAVTWAKTQAIATARILGRTTASSGDVEELTSAQVKALLAITASDVSDFNTAVRTNRLDQMAAPTGTVSMGAQFVSNVYAPFFGTDAANKTYVDTTTAAAVAAALTTAFDFKASVRAATTANITLSGAQTIDGVSVIAGDRVLVKNQSTGANNGIYVAAAGAWARATDADASAEVTAGLTVPVTEGTVNGGRMWMLSTADAITLGTTALTFTRVDTGDLQAASNLSDLLSVSTARTNLGLGTLALASTITSAEITDGTIANGDLADMTTKTYKGRTAGTTGPPQDVSAATLATDLASQTAFTATYAPIASPTLTGVATSPVWSTTGITGAVTATRYVGGTASVAPTTGTFVTGDFVIAANGKVWICTAGGSPGTWAQSGSATYLALAGGTMSGAIAMGSNKITGLTDGTAAADAATFNQARWAEVAVPLVSTYYVRSPAQLSTTTGTPTLNLMQCIPIVFANAGTLTSIAAANNANTASAVCRLGLYADNGSGQPGALIDDYGTVDFSTGPTTKTITISRAVTAMTLYWLAAVEQGAATSAKVAANGSGSGLTPGYTTPLNSTIPTQCWTQASVSGGLPNPAVVTATGTSSIIVEVKV